MTKQYKNILVFGSLSIIGFLFGLMVSISFAQLRVSSFEEDYALRVSSVMASTTVDSVTATLILENEKNLKEITRRLDTIIMLLDYDVHILKR